MTLTNYQHTTPHNHNRFQHTNMTDKKQQYYNNQYNDLAYVKAFLGNEYNYKNNNGYTKIDKILQRTDSLIVIQYLCGTARLLSKWNIFSITKFNNIHCIMYYMNYQSDIVKSIKLHKLSHRNMLQLTCEFLSHNKHLSHKDKETIEKALWLKWKYSI